MSMGVVSGKRDQLARDVTKVAMDEEAWLPWSSSGSDNDANADDDDKVPMEKIAGVAGPPG